MRIGTKTAAIVMLAGWLLTGSARGQWLDVLLPSGVPGYGTTPGVTVTTRLRPELQPPPLRAGALLLRPSLRESIGFDDNVLAGSGRRGSLVQRSEPALLLGTDWSRDALGGYFAADDRRDWGTPAQSRTDWTASLGGSLNIGRDRLTIAAAHLAHHQERSELDALASDRPVAFRVDDLRATYDWSFGRWSLTPNVEASAWHFDATSVHGTPVAQTYRDRNVLQGGVTLRYGLAPLRNLLLMTRAIGQHYLHPSLGQPTQDSAGYQVLAGIDYDDNAVWRYRLLFGGEHRGFAAAAFRAHDALIAEAEITWLPTGMTTVSARLTRSIEDAAQEGVAGFTATRASLAIDHELRRDMLLHGRFGVQHADFLQSGTQQTAFTFGIGATWLANRYLHVSATYDFGTQRSTGGTTQTTTVGSYTRNIALLAVRLGW